MTPSRDALDLNASLRLVRAALGTPLERDALALHMLTVLRVKARAGR